MTASPATRHQRILLNLSYLLQSHLETHPTGEIFFAPFDVLLSEFNVFVPDLIYLSRERSYLLTSKNLRGAPDLAVEILSPSTRARDMRLKRDVYARTGVLEYWVIDPDGDTVTVHGVASSSPSTFAAPVRYDRLATLTTSLLPGLSLPLERVLPQPG